MVRLVEGQIVDDEGEGGFLASIGTVNLLGFRVSLYWAGVILVFAFLKFGVSGLVVVGIVAGASHYGCNDDGSSGGSGGRRRPFSRGSNVRGIGDLPRPPPSS